MRGGELAQIDLLSGPAWPHRRERSHDTRIGIKPAQRVGVSTFRATRVEQKIVKVPKNEAGVTLGQAARVSSGLYLEKDLAMDQQGEKLDPRKPVLSTEPFDLLRCGKCGDLAAAIFGSQILNSAPARGDSNTISFPRRRMYANRDRTRTSALPSGGIPGRRIGNLRFDDNLDFHCFVNSRGCTPTDHVWPIVGPIRKFPCRCSGRRTKLGRVADQWATPERIPPRPR